MDRRALYNSLRMNWLMDPTIQVEDWQVEDYREMPFSLLFERLKKLGIALDRHLFCAYADSHSSPEDMADELSEHLEEEHLLHDKAYLLIFELWRRLMSERPCLSVFCDELDQQIFLYDSGEGGDNEKLQGTVADLQSIVEENCDEGAEVTEVFSTISQGCAHDIEAFLYDYISKQIEVHDDAYAIDLLDGFLSFVSDKKWFLLLKARVLSSSETTAATKLVRRLMEEAAQEKDLEFDLELLAYLAIEGSEELFMEQAGKMLPLITLEEDFKDFLNTFADFYHYNDLSEKEKEINAILKQRRTIAENKRLTPSDAHLEKIAHALPTKET